MAAAETAARLGRAAHRGAAPGIALLSSCLAVACMVSVPDVVRNRLDFAVVDPRWVGWLGVAVVAAVFVAIGVLLVSHRVGAGPGIAGGAGCAIVGTALAHDVSSDLQLVLAPVWLGVAVGALWAGGAAIICDLPDRLARSALAAWLVPLVGGWPLVTWAAQHSPNGAELAVHVPLWLLVPAALLLVCWGLIDLTDESRDASRSLAGAWWDSAWFGLAVLVVAGGTAVMLVGFAGPVSATWLRPLVVLIAAAAVAGFVVVGRLIPDPAVRRGYVAVLAALVCTPACVQVLLAGVTTDGGAGTAGVGGAVAGIVGSAVLGTVAGMFRRTSAAVSGLVLAALGSALGWLVLGQSWLSVAAAALVSFGMAAAVAAGIRLASRDRLALALAATAGLAGLVFGLVVSVPLGWALTGALPVDRSDVLAVGRVVLGLTVAVAVVTAVVVAAMAAGSVARQRADRAASAPRSVTRSSADARSTK